MSWVAFLGSVETGLVFSLVALGVFVTFRVLSFPDLTVDGSFALGGAVASVLIISGMDPFLASLAAAAAGAMAGLVTAWLHVKLRIMALLASILTMIGLYSINIRIMKGPTVPLLNERTVITAFDAIGLKSSVLGPLVFVVVAAFATAALCAFLLSERGLAMRATGANPTMARAHGVRTTRAILLGLAICNGLVGLSGGLLAQAQGAADVSMGIGVVIIGLAAVIGGTAVVPGRMLVLSVIACVLGSILYQLIVAASLNAGTLGLTASDVNLVTAVLVCIAIVLSNRAGGLGARLRSDVK